MPAPRSSPMPVRHAVDPGVSTAPQSQVVGQSGIAGNRSFAGGVDTQMRIIIISAIADPEHPDPYPCTTATSRTPTSGPTR